MSAEPTPACFADDPEAFELYREDGGHRRACYECELAYQEEMEARGLCTPPDPLVTPRYRAGLFADGAEHDEDA